MGRRTVGMLPSQPSGGPSSAKPVFPRNKIPVLRGNFGVQPAPRTLPQATRRELISNCTRRAPDEGVMQKPGKLMRPTNLTWPPPRLTAGAEIIGQSPPRNKPLTAPHTSSPHTIGQTKVATANQNEKWLSYCRILVYCRINGDDFAQKNAPGTWPGSYPIS